MCMRDGCCKVHKKTKEELRYCCCPRATSSVPARGKWEKEWHNVKSTVTLRGPHKFSLALKQVWQGHNYRQEVLTKSKVVTYQAQELHQLFLC